MSKPSVCHRHAAPRFAGSRRLIPSILGLTPQALRCRLLRGLVLLLLLSPLFAQGPTTGALKGTVTDPRGAVIGGAKVTITNSATGDERTTTTDSEGHYVFPLLAPGIYKARVVITGFAIAATQGFQVFITQTKSVDIQLELAGADTVSLNVTGLVQTDGAQLGRAVDSRFVSELPTASRNYTQIVSLSPGVDTYLPDSTGLGRNTQTISVNGARMTQNNVQINGLDANTMGTGAAANIAVPAPETIQEFKVQTSVYNATFGRSGGGNIEIVTRSGSNNFHGAVYEYFRNDALNANNPFLKAARVPRPVLRRNVFGGTVGGPIKKDRVFFFGAYQGTRETNGASILNSISSEVLVDPNLTDDRSEATLTKNYHLSSIYPAALALLNVKLPDGRYSIPTPQPDGKYTGSSISRFSEDQFHGNLDYRLSQKDWLSVKAFFARAPSDVALPSIRGTGPNVPGFGTSQQNNFSGVAVQDTRSFSATTFNELRFGYNAQRNYISAAEPVRDSELGIFRVNQNVFPGLGLIRINAPAGGVVIGTQTNVAPAFPWVGTIANTLTMTRGRHVIAVGGEVRFNEVDFTQPQFSLGLIDFKDFASFLTGVTQSSTLGDGISNRKQRALDYNLFLNDEWKFSPRLTLTLGLRYELDLPPYDTRGRISTFDPSLYRPPDPKNPLGPPSAGFVQAGNVIPAYDLPNVPNVSKYVIHNVDTNNIAPRAGFAFVPFGSGRFVLRAGYGIFHSRPTFQYISTSVTTPPGYVLLRASNLNPPLKLDNPFVRISSQDPFPKFVGGVALAGTVLDRDICTPYFHQYNTSIQYEIGWRTLIEAAYAGTHGLNLFRQVAINQARLASPLNPIINAGETITINTPANAISRVPFQGVDLNGFFQNQTTARSSYDSLQVSLTRRMEKGLQAFASYTYAKSIDNASGTGGGAGIAGIVNPGSVGDTATILGNQLNNDANRGVSDFDRAHRFTLSSLWDIPGRRNQSVLLSNWELSGIIVAMSGLPIDIIDSNAGSLYLGNNNGLSRPSWAPGATRATATQNVLAGYFFNPYAFARPVVKAGQAIPSSNGTAIAGATGTDFGNVGRNVLRGPSQANFDFSIIKRFPFRESTNLELRAEFFNLFNHVNFANPISNFNAAGGINSNNGQIMPDNAGDFGRIISTSNNPRLIQFVAKLNF